MVTEGRPIQELIGDDPIFSAGGKLAFNLLNSNIQQTVLGWFSLADTSRRLMWGTKILSGWEATSSATVGQELIQELVPGPGTLKYLTSR